MLVPPCNCEARRPDNAFDRAKKKLGNLNGTVFMLPLANRSQTAAFWDLFVRMCRQYVGNSGASRLPAVLAWPARPQDPGEVNLSQQFNSSGRSFARGNKVALSHGFIDGHD